MALALHDPGAALLERFPVVVDLLPVCQGFGLSPRETLAQVVSLFERHVAEWDGFVGRISTVQEAA